MKVKPALLPFKDAETFWADKVPLDPGQYAQLTGAAKARAFSVSGMARGDELETVFNALQRSITDGTTFADFKEACKDVFARRGWDGDGWRLENIFRTNIQTAYMAGRFKQMKAAAAARPYWSYSAVNDKRTRATHRALHGKIFPADHAFWGTWYPPNGFRCRCTVRSLSARQVKARGLTVEKKDPTNGLVEPVDPKTGNQLPAVPLVPDPGFDHNPGVTAFGALAPQEGGGGFEDIGQKTFADHRRRKIGNLSKKSYRPIGENDILGDAATYRKRTGKKQAEVARDFVAWFLEEFGLEPGQSKVIRDVVGEPLVISDELFRRRSGTYKIVKRGRERYLRLLARTIVDPYEVWLVPQRHRATGMIVLRKRFIRAFSSGPDEKITGFVAFDYHKKGWEGVTAFPPDDLEYVDGLRNGLLLYGE